MLKTTNLDEVKQVAVALMYMDIAVNERYGFLVDHPYFDNIVYPVQVNGQHTFVDLREAEGLKNARETLSKAILKVQRYLQFLMLVRKSYLPAFFKFTNKYASKQDYSEFLGEMWCMVEYANSDANITPNEFIKYFQKADRSFLMNEEELQTFNALPNEITIYRGVKPKSSISALSWSLNKSVAKWFADRFEKNGVVYKAKVKKEDVLAFFDRRSEDEVVVDYTKLYDITKL